MASKPKDDDPSINGEQPPPRQKTWLEAHSNPLSLTVVGAFLTLIATIVTGYWEQKATEESNLQRARLARESARQELQAELIKKFVEVPKTDTVRGNLSFLIEAGLLPDYADNIQAYLDSNPEAAPKLGMTQGVVGNDERAPLETVDLSTQADFRGIGILRITLGPGAQTLCSGFLVAPDVVLTGQCGTALSQDDPAAKNHIGSFELIEPTTSTTTRLDLDTSRLVLVKSGDWDIVLIGLKPNNANAAHPYLALDASSPVQGQRFGMAFYANDKKKFVYSADTGCRVLIVGDRELGHLCDTGAGAGGGPLVTPDGVVIGVHMGNAQGAKRAMRADVIRKDPTVIQTFGNLPRAL